MRGGHRVENGRGLGVALALAATVLAPSVNAQTATAGVRAEVVTPAEITVAAATEWLLSDSPGVFTLRIPGAASTGTTAQTTGTVEGSSDMIVFSASSQGAEALRQLIAQIAISAQSQVVSIAANGTINGQGVQVTLMKANQNADNSDAVVAIIAFD